jgi:glycosyltransferase involved in cell wall biosynthesis
MRVLLWAPVRSPFGGHVVQIQETARRLAEQAGIGVTLSHEDKPEWSNVDLVHGFGLELRHVRSARQRGLPVCLSVIYWSKAYRLGLLDRGSPWTAAVTRLKQAAAAGLAAARGRLAEKSEALARFTIETRALYESADLLLPNSTLEAEQIMRDLGTTTPQRVVPNAADPETFLSTVPWEDRQGVAYAGRVEPHKNQLELVRALDGTGIPVTLVGPDHPDHPRYCAAVREAAGSNVAMLPQQGHHELAALLSRARVHAMPSGFESTGLASLEAALAGCNIVTTDVGYAREYFRDLAWYCSPHDRPGIRQAVLDALSAPFRSELRQRILDHYTWEHTAAATATAYADLLEHRL